MTPIEQLAAVRNAVIRYSVPAGHQTQRPLSYEQQAILSQFHETGDHNVLRVLGDHLMENGSYLHGEALHAALDRGHVEKGESLYRRHDLEDLDDLEGLEDLDAPSPHVSIGPEFVYTGNGASRRTFAAAKVTIHGKLYEPPIHAYAPLDRDTLGELYDHEEHNGLTSKRLREDADGVKSGHHEVWDGHPNWTYLDH